MEGSQFFGILIAAVGFLAAATAAVHALLHKRRPQSAFGWIAVCFTLPLAGALLYYLFGVNRVKTLAKKLLTGHPEPPCPTDYVGTAPYELESLAQLGFAVTGLPLTAGNGVELLHSAEDTFAAMLAAIRSATQRVLLATYIFDSGPVGQRFVAALSEAAARGVDVRVLIDGVGELYSWPKARSLLRGTRVRVARFLPPRLWPPFVSINLRNHRKILVTDGATAFTGGMNIRDRYLHESVAQRMVDLHFRLTGPVVAQIEAVFMRDWHFATSDEEPIAPTPPAPAGTALCRTVADGPAGPLDRLTGLFVGAIGHARRRVGIMTPYFLPPREVHAPLQAAALAGIDVAVVLPAQNNLPYIHRATRHMLWELLECGVRVYYQPPPFVHSKLFYIDEHYAQIGSANLDPRSLRLNFEMNVEIYDPATVAELARHFLAVRANSTEITLAAVDGRPFGTKVLDGAAWLFSPYL